jgi:hypothetical protein
MSSDIKQRLQRIQATMANEEEDAVLAAIARIEALEWEVADAELRGERAYEYGKKRQAELIAALDAAEARAERLRVALQDVVDAYDFVIVNEYDRGWSSVSDAVVAARKAIRAAAGETSK